MDITRLLIITLFLSISPTAGAQTCRELFLIPSTGDKNYIQSEFKNRLKNLAQLAHKRGYSNDPIVMEIREWVRELTRGVGDMNAGELILFGEMYRKKKTLILNFPSIMANGNITIGERPRGLNVQFGKAIYGILLGIRDAVQTQKGIEDIHIIASEIYNLELIKMLESYGFHFTQKGQASERDQTPWYQYELQVKRSDLEAIL